MSYLFLSAAIFMFGPLGFIHDSTFCFTFALILLTNDGVGSAHPTTVHEERQVAESEERQAVHSAMAYFLASSVCDLIMHMTVAMIWVGGRWPLPPSRESRSLLN